MDFHGIDTKGKIWIERIATKPANSADNDGRIILALDTNMVSFGTNGVWIDIADDSGVDVTSNPDPQIAINAGNIATNAGNIATNAADIAALQAALPGVQSGVIPAGSIFIIDSATQLTGWTILSSVTDTILYVDTGGNSGPKAGSTWTQPQHAHATQSHALTISEMPSHSHPPKSGVANFMSSTGSSHGRGGDSYGVHTSTGNTGGGAGHNHGNTLDNGTVSSWRPLGYNVTRQQKNAY
jgi:hypothetical protein